MNQIKLVAFDIDGTLTDGTITYVGNGEWAQRFSVRDGMGIKRLMEQGIEVAFISAAKIASAKFRAEMLGVKHAYFGVENKLEVLRGLASELGIEDLKNVAYMGDELDDIPCIEAVGIGATVPESPRQVKDVANYICSNRGGYGAAREFAEHLLEK